MRNLMVIIVGMCVSFTAGAQGTSLSKMDAATQAEDFCLVSTYFDEVASGKSGEQAKIAALDSCVKPGVGRLGYVDYMAAKFHDSPRSETEAAKLKSEVRQYGSMALNRGVSQCEFNRVSKDECLTLLKLK